MTDTQAKQIRDLRLKGIGYKAIASVLGLSRDVVRIYCKNKGLGGYGVNTAEPIQQGNTCPYCSHNCYVHDRSYRDEEYREPYVSPAKGDKQQCHTKPQNHASNPAAAT